MKQIKFSEDYEKLPNVWAGTQATLIAVYPEKREMKFEFLHFFSGFAGGSVITNIFTESKNHIGVLFIGLLIGLLYEGYIRYSRELDKQITEKERNKNERI